MPYLNNFIHPQHGYLFHYRNNIFTNYIDNCITLPFVNIIEHIDESCTVTKISNGKFEINGYVMIRKVNINNHDELCKYIVKQYPNAIGFVKNPSEELCKLAVQEDGYAIRHIKNPSEEVCKLAVQQNGWAIQFIKNPSKEVCQMAIKLIGANAWSYIPHKDLCTIDNTFTVETDGKSIMIIHEHNIFYINKHLYNYTLAPFEILYELLTKRTLNDLVCNIKYNNSKIYITIVLNRQNNLPSIKETIIVTQNYSKDSITYPIDTIKQNKNLSVDICQKDILNDVTRQINTNSI